MRKRNPSILIHSKALCLTVLMLLGALSMYGQQKAQFTQYMFNGLVLNPAYAGSEESLSLTFLNRSQWASIDGAPVTQTLSAHTLFGRKHLGVGLYVINDKIGIHKNQQAVASVAYHLQVSQKGYFSFGLQGGIAARKSDYNALSAGNIPDPRLNSTSISQTYFNIGAGIYYRSPKLDIGLSAPELIPEHYALSDSVTISWQKSQYFLFARYRLRLTDHLDFEPGVLVKYQEGVPVSFDINGCVVIRKVLTLGVSYRRNESIDLLLKAQITPQLQLGYAYDIVTGSVSRSSSGSHEILVNYRFNFTKNKISAPR